MHDIDCLRRSSMLYLDRYRKLQMYNPQQEVVAEVEVVVVEVEVEVEVVVEDYLGRTDLQELSTRKQGNKYIVLEEAEVVEVDSQDME